MKKMRKALAVILVLAMVLCLCACGNPEKALVGTWRYECDLSGMMEEEFAAALGSELNVDASLVMPIMLTFNEDKTCAITFDVEATSESLTGYLEALNGTLIEFMYAQAEAQGLDRETMDAAILETSGMTMEEYCTELLGMLDVDSLVSDLDEEFLGVFKVDGSKLYMEDSTEDFSDESYVEFELDGDTLRFVSDNSGDLPFGEFGIDYPIDFVKQ